VIRATRPGDRELLAPLLRPEDTAEVLASDSHTPLEALAAGEVLTPRPYTVEIDGVPAAMFGVTVHGVVWLLGSAALTADRRWFMRTSRKVIDVLGQRHSLLYNAVDIRYMGALRWLAHLGFRRHGVTWINGHEFLVLIWEADDHGWSRRESEEAAGEIPSVVRPLPEVAEPQAAEET